MGKKLKLGTQTGSLMNYFQSGNETPPVVGKGATELLWSDRHAWEVTSISKDGKTCEIARYKPKRIDKYGMSDNQHYEYKEFTGETRTLYWKWGAWRYCHNTVVFTKEAQELAESQGYFCTWKILTPEQKKTIYTNADGEKTAQPSTVFEGLTKPKKEYHKMKIVFGYAQEYYDFTF